MPMQVDLQTRRYLPSERLIEYWIHSGTGSDTNAGTEGSPLATTEEALGRIPSMMWGRRAVLWYLPGHLETIVRPLFMPPVLGGGPVDDLTLDGVDMSWDYIAAQIMMKAAPVTVDNLTGVQTLADATSGLVKITDATKNWTPNEHVGRGLINPGAPAECGMIWSNTATELFVASVGFSGSALRIVRRDARLVMGDSASFMPSGLLPHGIFASLGIVGMTLEAPVGAGPALDITSSLQMAMLLCEIKNGFQCRSRAGQITMDACYLNGGAYAPNAGELAVRQSLMSGLTANFHASNGQYDLFGNRIQNCGAMGHGGTSTPHGGFRIESCWIANGTQEGIKYFGGVRSNIINTRIDSCASHAIRAEGSGTLLVQNVTGSGNVGYGAYIDNGMNVNPSSSPTVAGTLGQVRLGGSGGATHNWSAAPQSVPTRNTWFGT